MKYNLELSKLAIKDIDDIWLYTFENWSKVQANKYYKELFVAIDRICQNPEIGKSLNDVKPNHRITKFKSHMIVYKLLDQTVYLDRILHERMDIDSFLDV